MTKAELKSKLEEMYKFKSSMLCQQSRPNWQLRGEKNTKFFHRAISRRRRTNFIHSLQSNQGWVTTPSEVKKTLLLHFQTLLRKETKSRIFNIQDDLLKKLQPSMKDRLNRSFSLTEVEEALKASDSCKAPGLDGLNTGVLKAIWRSFQKDFMKLLSDFHSKSVIPKGLNSSFIALIPKLKEASSPADFRPISLMNSTIKLLTKVLARRLSEVMNFLITNTQSAFIRSRQMSDCILITNEVYSALHSKKCNGVIMKLDFAKAFDTINWKFIYHIMERMNLGERWVSWIKVLFDSSRISVLVNGTPTDEFSPLRGLRQGDPLSPLIFNLMGEVLSKMLATTNVKKIFSGIALPNLEGELTHLQYADDVILFINNDTRSIKGVKRIL